MPKRTIFFLSLSCVAVAVVILFISITATSPVYRLEGGSSGAGRRFYVSREILPDHVFYPLFNLTDHSLLSMAEPEEKPWLKLETAQRRLDAAQALHEKDKEKSELVLMTFGKSHSYLLQAGNDLLAMEAVPAKELEYFQDIILKRDELFKQIGAELLDSDRAIIDEMRRSEAYLYEKICERHDELSVANGEQSTLVREGAGT